MNDAPKIPAADPEIPEDAPWPKLGPCCSCGRSHKTVRNVYSLDFEAPVPGTGWGCVACGLPSDGAIAVRCDACHDKNEILRFVCVGFADKGKRMPFDAASLAPAFTHDMKNHPGEAS